MVVSWRYSIGPVVEDVGSEVLRQVDGTARVGGGSVRRCRSRRRCGTGECWIMGGIKRNDYPLAPVTSTMGLWLTMVSVDVGKPRGGMT
jgi:hypothetical protein